MIMLFSYNQMYMKITVKSNEYPIKINMSNIPDGIDKLDIVIDQGPVQNSIRETNVDVNMDPNIDSNVDSNMGPKRTKRVTQFAHKYDPNFGPKFALNFEPKVGLKFDSKYGSR